MIGQADAYINGRKYEDAKRVLDKFNKLFPNSNLKNKANTLQNRIKDLQAGK